MACEHCCSCGCHRRDRDGTLTDDQVVTTTVSETRSY